MWESEIDDLAEPEDEHDGAGSPRSHSESAIEQDDGDEEKGVSPSTSEPETASTDEVGACLSIFRGVDFIMEPRVFHWLGRYFRFEGEPEPVVENLSSNYVGLAKVCELVGEWLTKFGLNSEELFEKNVSSLVLKHFDPRLADRLFDMGEGHSQDPDFQFEIAHDAEFWLPELINHERWRGLIYQLASEYPDSLLLNFAVKLISDAGYQQEISKVTTASHQLEIFSRVLITTCRSVVGMIEKEPHTDSFETNLNHLQKIVSNSEHTYMFSQLVLRLAAFRMGTDETKSSARNALTYLSQRIRTGDTFNEAAVAEASLDHKVSSLLDLTLLATFSSAVGASARLILAMTSMLLKGALNPADITVLYDGYKCEKTSPPVQLLREPSFIDLLVDALFGPGISKIQLDQKHKYVYLLAYACSVVDVQKSADADEKSLTLTPKNKAEVKQVEVQLDQMSSFCQDKGKGDTGAQILAQIKTIFEATKTPLLAYGLFHWIYSVVTDPDYLVLHTESVPIHLILLDEIASHNFLLQPRIFGLFVLLFDRLQETSHVDDSIGGGERLIERLRMIIDRFIHLLSAGFALPVVGLVLKKHRSASMDVSLTRYFVAETLEIIAPPYSSDFTDLFLPLIEDREICDENFRNKHPAIGQFIEYMR